MAFLFKSRKHPHSQHQSAQAASAHHPEGSGGGVERSGSSSKSSHHSRSRTMGPASSGTQALPQPQQQLHTSRSDEHQFRPVEDNYHLGQNFPHPHHYNSSQNQLNLQQQQQASPEKRSRGGSLSEPRVSCVFVVFELYRLTAVINRYHLIFAARPYTCAFSHGAPFQIYVYPLVPTAYYTFIN